MWTVIGYIIATGATIVDVYYTYRQYKHSLRQSEIPNKNIELEKLTELKELVSKIYNPKNYTTAEYAAIPTSASKPHSDLISLIRTTQNDFYKVGILEEFVANFSRTLPEDEVYNIISLFTNDFHRSNAISVLSPKIKRPVSENYFFKILSTFRNDFHKNSAKNILLYH